MIQHRVTIRWTIDPNEVAWVEAMRRARDTIKAEIKASGRKLSAFSAADLTAKAEAWCKSLELRTSAEALKHQGFHCANVKLTSREDQT
jgi:hypothetical protein